jgi:hypothetical protein
MRCWMIMGEFAVVSVGCGTALTDRREEHVAMSFNGGKDCEYALAKMKWADAPKAPFLSTSLPRLSIAGTQHTTPTIHRTQPQSKPSTSPLPFPSQHSTISYNVPPTGTDWT